MRTGQDDRRYPDESGIPEFDAPRHGHDIADAMQEIGRGIINAFTVERDTSLAEGAGAPGSTDVGGMATDDDGEQRATGNGQK